MHIDTNITITDIATLLLALVTFGSLIYVSRQVTATRQQTRGQFLLALDDQFEKTNPISMRLLQEPQFTPHDTEWIDIWRLMSVFERINIMVEDKMLGIDLVYRLHGFRLLKLIENDAVFARVQAAGADWQDFIDICYKIADYRMRANATARPCLSRRANGSVDRQYRDRRAGQVSIRRARPDHSRGDYASAGATDRMAHASRTSLRLHHRGRAHR